MMDLFTCSRCGKTSPKFGLCLECTLAPPSHISVCPKTKLFYDRTKSNCCLLCTKKRCDKCKCFNIDITSKEKICFECLLKLSCPRSI